MGWGLTLTFLPFGPTWQKHRKLMQTTFSHTNVRQWHDLQIRGVRTACHHIAQRPDDWEMILKRRVKPHISYSSPRRI